MYGRQLLAAENNPDQQLGRECGSQLYRGRNGFYQQPEGPWKWISIVELPDEEDAASQDLDFSHVGH